MVLPDSFFSDRTVSQILGELMDIRRDCQSWLAVGEAHYHDRKGKAQAINKAPQWLIPARIYRKFGSKTPFFNEVEDGFTHTQ
jgi:hypothetical protein